MYSDYFARLPNLYYEFYKNIFSKNNEYRYSCKVDYYLYKDDQPNGRRVFRSRINVYEQSEDRIEINNTIIPDDAITELELRNGLIYKSCPSSFTPQGTNQQLFYDGVRCWLYQGICNKLGLKIDGINYFKFNGDHLC